MKIVEVQPLAIPEVKRVRFARFLDHRGYFTETFRTADFFGHPALAELRGLEFVQINESYSRPDVCRGLHFQWDPPMGKLVRPIVGRMIDFALDLRAGSPTRGKIVGLAMDAAVDAPAADWIWVPPGFAHGVLFLAATHIEYLCTAFYNPACEAGISPLADDIDWSLCEPALHAEFRNAAQRLVLSEKDRQGLALAAWLRRPEAQLLAYRGGRP